MQALLQSLGDRKGLNRFGHFTAPLDEAAVEVILVSRNLLLYLHSMDVQFFVDLMCLYMHHLCIHKPPMLCEHIPELLMPGSSALD